MEAISNLHRSLTQCIKYSYNTDRHIIGDSQLKLELQHTTPHHFDVIGSVQNVIEGHIPKHLANQKFMASDYAFGFELASPNSLESMGESVIVNNYCYATSSEANSSSYHETISGKSFFTTGMLTLPKSARGNYNLSLPDSSNEISYYSLLKQVFEGVQKPFVLVAHVNYKSIHATAIAKAPIYNENIFENKREYYCISPIHLVNTHAFIVACVADFSHLDDKKLHDTLQLVLYHNPMDKQESLNIHTHGITLKRDIQSYEQITPSIVDKTLHIFTDETVVQAIKGEVYIIGSLRSI